MPKRPGHQHGRGAAEMLQGTVALRIHTVRDKRCATPAAEAGRPGSTERPCALDRTAPWRRHRLSNRRQRLRPAAGAWRAEGVASGSERKLIWIRGRRKLQQAK